MSQHERKNSCIKLWLLPLLDTYPFAPSFWNILMTYSLSRSFSFPANHDLSCSIFLYSMIWTSILERFHPENALKSWSSFNFEPVCLQSPIRSSFHVVQRIDYSGSQIGGISVFSKSNTLKDFMLVLQWSLFDPCLWGEYKMNYTNTNEWTLVRLTASLA